MENPTAVDTTRFQVAAGRSQGLDILKCICAFFIVWIHSPLDQGIAMVFRAVAIFFIITGYYYQSTADKGREGAQLKKLLLLYIGSNLVYFPIMLVFNGGASATITRQNIINHFLFGDGLTIGALWYMHAIVLALVIVYAAERTKKGRKILYPLVPVLLLANLCIGNYSILLFSTEFPAVYTRNFLLYGLPFLLIGDILRQKRELWRGKRKAIFAVACAALVFGMVEYWLLNRYNLEGNGLIYISTPILMPLVFMFVMSDRKASASGGSFKVFEKIKNVLADIGREHSLAIYLVHPLVHGVFKYAVLWLLPAYYELYVYLSPVLIFVASWILSWCFFRAMALWKEKRKAKLA